MVEPDDDSDVEILGGPPRLLPPEDEVGEGERNGGSGHSSEDEEDKLDEDEEEPESEVVDDSEITSHP